MTHIRPDLQMDDGKLFGECFLCYRQLTLRPARDGNVVGYRCPQCGGLNSAKRVEAGLTFDGHPLPTRGGA